jgi:hypothetical protein
MELMLSIKTIPKKVPMDTLLLAIPAGKWKRNRYYVGKLKSGLLIRVSCPPEEIDFLPTSYSFFQFLKLPHPK